MRKMIGILAGIAAVLLALSYIFRNLILSLGNPIIYYGCPNSKRVARLNLKKRIKNGI